MCVCVQSLLVSPLRAFSSPEMRVIIHVTDIIYTLYIAHVISGHFVIQDKKNATR